MGGQSWCPACTAEVLIFASGAWNTRKGFVNQEVQCELKHRQAGKPALSVLPGFLAPLFSLSVSSFFALCVWACPGLEPHRSSLALFWPVFVSQPPGSGSTVLLGEETSTEWVLVFAICSFHLQTFQLKSQVHQEAGLSFFFFFFFMLWCFHKCPLAFNS